MFSTRNPLIYFSFYAFFLLLRLNIARGFDVLELNALSAIR